MLNHVQDPIGALQRIAYVTDGVCIIANPVDPDNTSSVPRARLVSRSGSGTPSQIATRVCQIR